jgi:hypothetical protein
MIDVVNRTSLEALFNRVKLTLTKSEECWNTFVSENPTPRKLIKSLLLPLLLIGALCSVLGRQLFGVYVPFLDTWHPPLFEEIVVHVVQIFFTLGALFVGARALEKLAPHFGGCGDMNRSFSLLAHSSIPVALAQILSFIPILYGALALVISLGYSIHLFYRGSSTMLDIPDNQRLTFAGAGIGVMILIGVVGVFLAAFIAPPIPPGTLPI